MINKVRRELRDIEVNLKNENVIHYELTSLSFPEFKAEVQSVNQDLDTEDCFELFSTKNLPNIFKELSNSWNINVGEKLGSGRYGFTYKCEFGSCHFAIKFASKENWQMSPEQIKYLRTTKRLISVIYDWTTHDGAFTITLMELQSMTLKEAIKKLPRNDLCLVFSFLAYNLEEMHKEGYAHCDIHSQNIMCTDMTLISSWKLIDFSHFQTSHSETEFYDWNGLAYTFFKAMVFPSSTKDMKRRGEEGWMNCSRFWELKPNVQAFMCGILPKRKIQNKFETMRIIRYWKNILSLNWNDRLTVEDGKIIIETMDNLQFEKYVDVKAKEVLWQCSKTKKATKKKNKKWKVERTKKQKICKICFKVISMVNYARHQKIHNP